MLSQRERDAIEDHAARLPTRMTASVEALVAVQRQRGHIDDDALDDVAAALGQSRHQLDGLASFYNLIYRRPVGRHVVLLCDSVSCWMLGCDRLQRRIGELLGCDYGETSADGLFTVLPMACLGACERAPALMIGEDLHTEVLPEDLAELLEGYRQS